MACKYLRTKRGDEAKELLVINVFAEAASVDCLARQPGSPSKTPEHEMVMRRQDKKRQESYAPLLPGAVAERGIACHEGAEQQLHVPRTNALRSYIVGEPPHLLVAKAEFDFRSGRTKGRIIVPR
jgi:hypothetical protein